MPSAFITGVSRGIGYALAENLLNRGIHVVGVARASAEQIPELITHPNFSYISGDLSRQEGLDAVDLFITSHNYAFDSIVHNAAIIDSAPLQDALPEDIERVIALNLLAPMKLTRILAPTYRAGTRILFISSGAATYPIEQLGAYCVSKAGLAMLARVLRAEYATRPDIAVASVMPGVVDTAMQYYLRENTQGAVQAEFQDLYHQNELISASYSASCIARLLCDVPFERYKKRAVWDIDDTPLKSFYKRVRALFAW